MHQDPLSFCEFGVVITLANGDIARRDSRVVDPCVKLVYSLLLRVKYGLIE